MHHIIPPLSSHPALACMHTLLFALTIDNLSRSLVLCDIVWVKFILKLDVRL